MGVNTDVISLAQLRDLMKDRGVVRLYYKKLAANDNSKNQPYFGESLSVLNILPTGRPVAGVTDGESNHSIIKAPMTFDWLSADGTQHKAPNAKLIFYPQYPEVRFSGYLAGADATHRPSELMGATRIPGRVLFLGVTDRGFILGFVAGPSSRIAREIEESSDLEPVGVFFRVPIESGDKAYVNRRLLLSELCRITSIGWIDSKRLNRERETLVCRASNCGGYTLEAELGITPNGYSEPDFRGWEVKQHNVGDFEKPANSLITLMTPEPSDGYYVDEGVVRFCEKWGYADKRGRPNRINFGGTFRSNVEEPNTGLTLELLGFDSEKQVIVDATGGVALLSTTGVEAAVWRYADLIAHWKRKHAFAAYVPSKNKKSPTNQYCYSSTVRLGTGTSFEKFLQALSTGRIVYDPGIKVENYPDAPKSKRRSQFRMKSNDLYRLYDKMETISACSDQ